MYVCSTIVRFPKGYLRSQLPSFGPGRKYERASNSGPPHRGQAVSTPESQSELAVHRPLPEAHSHPCTTELVSSSDFSTAESDPMTSFSTKPVPGVTGEPLKNEIDWNIWKIKQDLKKVQLKSLSKFLCLCLPPSLSSTIHPYHLSLTSPCPHLPPLITCISPTSPLPLPLSSFPSLSLSPFLSLSLSLSSSPPRYLILDMLELTGRV